MSHLPFSDREIERVLAGQQPYGRPELAEVAFFVARLRQLVDFESSPEMSSELRAQVEAAAAKAGGGRRRGAHRDEAAEPAAAAGDLQVVRLDERRRQPKALRGRWRLVGAAAAAVMAGGIVTVSLQAGGAPEAEVETETAEPLQGPTTTTAASSPTVTEAPAASAGEPPSRPSGVSTPPPDTQVQTRDVPRDDGPGSGSGQEGSDPPAWWPDEYWPRECRWPDWECACEEVVGDRHGGDDCDEMGDHDDHDDNDHSP